MRIESFTGKTSRQFIPALAQLRMQVFRAYPYLYDGTLEEESEYLESLVQSAETIIVIAFDGTQVVGASTGLPLAHEPEEIRNPWLKTPTPIETIFYFSESVLLKAYRGQGIGVKFFNMREAWAKERGYKLACFCAVIRPDDHPLRPKKFIPLNGFWVKRGFKQVSGLTCQMVWQGIDESRASKKELQFWSKEL